MIGCEEIRELIDGCADGDLTKTHRSNPQPQDLIYDHYRDNKSHIGVLKPREFVFHSIFLPFLLPSHRLRPTESMSYSQSRNERPDCAGRPFRAPKLKKQEYFSPQSGMTM